MKKNVLIIGAEKLSSIVDYSDRTTCVLFGDGAGAAIISAIDDKSRSIIDVKTSSDGEYQDFLITEAPGSRHGISQKILDEGMCYLKMKGNETFKLAVNTLTKDVFEILEQNSLRSEDIDWFVPHQANYRIINAVAKKLNMSEDRVVLTVSDYGNTSAASIPMAINRWYEEGRLKDKELMLLDTFGGGLTWGSALVYFNEF
jgi:3-oxoacyl-[acyl-carrier-protein] synthase-3